MKPTSQQTSLEAYESIKPLRRRRHRQIIEALAKHGDMCNKELSEATSLPINSVTPRVKELRDMGRVGARGFKEFKGRRVFVWGLL